MATPTRSKGSKLLVPSIALSLVAVLGGAIWFVANSGSGDKAREVSTTEKPSKHNTTFVADKKLVIKDTDKKLSITDVEQIQEHYSEYVLKMDKSHFVVFQRNNKKNIRQIKGMQLLAVVGELPHSEADKLNGVKPLVPVFLLPIPYPSELPYRDSTITPEGSSIEWSDWRMGSTDRRSKNLIFEITYILNGVEGKIDDKAIVKTSQKRVMLERIDADLAARIKKVLESETK